MKIKKRFFVITFGVLCLLTTLITQIPGIPNANATESTLIAEAKLETEYVGEIVNCSRFVKVYTSPTNKSNTEWHATKGESYVVNMSFDSQRWYEISNDDKTGYIKKKYVDLSAAATDVNSNTISPAPRPSPDPTAEPTAEPIAETTATPTAEPTAAPTSQPTTEPTAEPTASPTESHAASGEITEASPEASPTESPTGPYHELSPGDVQPAVEDDGVVDADGWYTIDNTQFGIDSTGNNARATTDGINNALEWAKEQEYTKIKFVTGTYLIQCNWNNRYIAPDDGILVPSGLTLDLGASTFQMEANDYPAYSLISVVNQSDVTILNGTLIGDLDNHVYSPSSDSDTHEWGFGIAVSASSNVTIRGVTISKMTGDGIILEGSYDYLSNGGSVSENVVIKNCDISNCRRQGISLVGVINSEIAENEIYDISGTDPQYGIDVEPELDYPTYGLKIHSNTIYGCSGGAITACKGSDYEIYNNNVIGNNILAALSSNVQIYGNTVNNSFIRVMPGATNITLTDNILDENSWEFFG